MDKNKVEFRRKEFLGPAEEATCGECGKLGIIIKVEREVYYKKGWRGECKYSRDITTLKCSGCGKIGKVSGFETEKDVSFYSMSQPDG